MNFDQNQADQNAKTPGRKSLLFVQAARIV
jgi:hypothetical protein